MDKITEERARACYIVHRGACEQWTHGEPAEVWRDENHVLCISASSIQITLNGNISSPQPG